MTPMESNALIKKLRAGEKVICPWCKKGHMVSKGDCKTTPGFHCNSCKARININ